ncbi:hypothetical protein C5167_035949 [Papaver somniferum]|uniref:uncharacterized protein LOC113331443 isoform X2 n=1 Tax=Papaver somniferum TaxID=3469 RepID=UPI000E6FCD6A|nr:uncharacterized protein LOC113331443 isoform X2 [Papaver somniferum]XP_026433935.1 uncharacterized protein LOC113331443 isoform X2 [Papaver somniferum]RZC87414.1 hypothetical protein C5167_035949 [Papaver somniferum]
MVDVNFGREIMEVDSSSEGSFGSGRHLESTATQMVDGTINSSPRMEITPSVGSPQLDVDPGVDSPQLVEMTSITEPDSQSIAVDLTPFFVTNQVFDSREAIIEWCQEVGKKNNTVLVISHSKRTLKGKGSRITLGCERSGWYTDHKKKSLNPNLLSQGKERAELESVVVLFN